MGCMPNKTRAQSKKFIINTTNNIAINNNMIVQEKKTSFRSEYDLQECLGEGSFGKVYKTKQIHTNNVRATKIIDKKLLKISKLEEDQFIKEISILKLLDHPNIMKIYEYFDTSKKLYLITELCTGGELFDRITEVNNFSEATTVHIMKQLLSAVCFCHANNIIHRDLKPENILIDDKEQKYNDFFLIKIIDFGTSCIKKGNNMREKIGTAYYIAPEVIRNNYNEKCDIWSIGVIMYILLSGIPPFSDDDDDKIFKKILKGKYDMSGSIWDNVSNEAKTLIHEMLNMNVQVRPSAEQCLKSDFFTKHNKKEKENTLGNEKHMENMATTFKNITSFKACKKLQQATLAFIVHHMSNKEEVEKMRKVFVSLDDNGDGRLTKEELKDGLLKATGNTKEIEQIMANLDNDNSGYIEFQEFLRAAVDKAKILTDDNIKHAFNLFDADRSGSISYQEIRKIFAQEQNIDIDDEVWKNMIEENDKTKKGELSLDDFKEMMLQLIVVNDNEKK